ALQQEQMNVAPGTLDTQLYCYLEPRGRRDGVGNRGALCWRSFHGAAFRYDLASWRTDSVRRAVASARKFAEPVCSRLRPCRPLRVPARFTSGKSAAVACLARELHYDALRDTDGGVDTLHSFTYGVWLYTKGSGGVSFRRVPGSL